MNPKLWRIIEEILSKNLCYALMGNFAVRSGANMLVWDEAKNKFTNSEKANEYNKPEYRKPWEFPKV